jgi:4-hydroxy-tetrahydrodipicolinate reductase
MKIILLGYGKMGKIIERIALKRGHEITARIDIDNQYDLAAAKGDVAIEFSHPDAAYENLRKILEKNIPVVCGTTGWLDRKKEIDSICRGLDGTFFYASNYSLGVNIFFKLNEYLAKVMQRFDEYNVELDEIHHTQKKDSPSGTAITLAEGILQNVSRKTRWVNEATEEPDDLLIKSFRIADVPGTHVVKYNSAVDDLEIKHTAHSREGFATGAVLVAEWIRHKKGVLSMDDFLKF